MMRRRVVCGLSETIATLPPQRAFTSVDFPTFGRPATATIPDLKKASTARTTPRPGWGSLPTALWSERSRRRRTEPCLGRADCATSALELPRLGQQLGRGVRDDLPGCISEDD